VFGIGPLINAAGRLIHANKAVDLLIEQDEEQAKDMAKELLGINQERRDIQQDTLLEAKQIVENDLFFAEKKATILFKETWHKGVIGIIASKMVEEYHKPTIIFTESNGRIVGSARSVPGFDVYQAIAQCEDLLVNYGGHKYAAGLTLKPSNFEAFTQRFQQIVAQNIHPLQEQAMLYIDATLNLEHINAKFWQLLEQFAPFGPKNMRPVFSSKHLKDTGYSKLLKNRHLKLVIQEEKGATMEGIAFGLGEHITDLQAQKLFEMCYVIEENNFKGRTKLQLNVKDMRFRS
jgi:single-stranded-DNA-specific exonuclease